MKKATNNASLEYLLSGRPFSLKALSFQTVFIVKGQEKYLKSFNVLNENRVIKKYYMAKLILLNEDLNIDGLIMETIIHDWLGNDQDNRPGEPTSQKKSSTFKSKKFDQEARGRAASDLFTSLGI